MVPHTKGTSQIYKTISQVTIILTGMEGLSLSLLVVAYGIRNVQRVIRVNDGMVRTTYFHRPKPFLRKSHGMTFKFRAFAYLHVLPLHTIPIFCPRRQSQDVDDNDTRTYVDGSHTIIRNRFLVDCWGVLWKMLHILLFIGYMIYLQEAAHRPTNIDMMVLLVQPLETWPWTLQQNCPTSHFSPSPTQMLILLFPSLIGIYVYVHTTFRNEACPATPVCFCSLFLLSS